MISRQSQTPIAIPMGPNGPEIARSHFISTVTESPEVARSAKDAVFVGDKPPSDDGTWQPVLLLTSPLAPKPAANAPARADTDDSPIGPEEAAALLLRVLGQQALRDVRQREQAKQERELPTRLLLTSVMEKLLQNLAHASPGDGCDAGSERLRDDAFRAALPLELDDAGRRTAGRIIGDGLAGALDDPRNTTLDAVADAASGAIARRLREEDISPTDMTDAEDATSDATTEAEAPDATPETQEPQIKPESKSALNSKFAFA